MSKLSCEISRFNCQPVRALRSCASCSRPLYGVVRDHSIVVLVGSGVLVDPQAIFEIRREKDNKDKQFELADFRPLDIGGAQTAATMNNHGLSQEKGPNLRRQREQ